VIFEASAPSNIALIKYMGKVDGAGNLPTNSSLSWTIEDLRSYVKLTHRSDLPKDEWAPLEGDHLAQIQLNEASRERFLNHFQSLKSELGVQENFLIQSANNFPADCGLASSASSFAALTMAAVEALGEFNPSCRDLSLGERAELSRKGSGSSCRSFFGPWSLWFKEGVRPIEFPMHQLLHQVIIVETEKKAVSSSQAHQRVTTSPLFAGRTDRAENRLAQLMNIFREGDQLDHWRAAFEIVWAEFWDMHTLFETSSPPFGYMLPGSVQILRWMENLWQSENDGPLVTMDAGANVHLLYRQDQKALAHKIRGEFQKEFNIFQCNELREETR